MSPSLLSRLLFFAFAVLAFSTFIWARPLEINRGLVDRRDVCIVDVSCATGVSIAGELEGLRKAIEPKFYALGECYKNKVDPSGNITAIAAHIRATTPRISGMISGQTTFNGLEKTEANIILVDMLKGLKSSFEPLSAASTLANSYTEELAGIRIAINDLRDELYRLFAAIAPLM
ncbi:hypothetical protein RSOLAG1IB_11758 [Rhizoctonia solani AG-1 IB]|uniref:Uncharacterized protein n=1 Tax=Thanatephorus cucumeris (strain AG1-IB / isolate 7/3/14) TaxID=1108050 RepID=A0A0B7FEN6_THACB|nr:hypothetical protein RSOLAG1IB_11758 [Rhizoctonia solani AG-1 IB]